MKILMINKYYYNFGGAENYIFGLTDLLKKKGHEVIPFSMQHEENYRTEYAKYFIRNIEYNSKNKAIGKLIKEGINSIYSIEARKKIKKLIQDTKPDIAHIHNFNYQITPSILFELKKKNIPVVQTLHDPQIICPFHRLYNYETKSICEKCINNKYYNAVKTKCIKNSYLKSFIGMAESYLYHFLKVYEKKIDLFISPSLFLKDKILEFGMRNISIEVIPNYFNKHIVNQHIEYDDFALYVGRISDEKGIQSLVKAFQIIPDRKLKVVGDGPLLDEIKVLDIKNNNIEYLGKKSQSEVKQLLSKCLFTVVPSEWYENCPLTVIESKVNRKCVVASNLGGNRELIIDGYTGLLFKSGDIKELAYKIDFLFSHKEKAMEMGTNAKDDSVKNYSPETHIKKILDIYTKLITNNN